MPQPKTKDRVLQALVASDGFISGEQLAANVGVSRVAIWKAMKALKEDGYHIEAITNRGYRLATNYDPLDTQSIRALLAEQAQTNFDLHVLKTTSSTNTILKELADQGAKHLSVVVAGGQTAGRGRRGKSFYSPEDTGIYISILSRKAWPIDKSAHITFLAAVAVCQSLEHICALKPRIKWVNDIYLENKKVCGILTEGTAEMESGMLSQAIIGIGINIYKPSCDIEPEIEHVFAYAKESPEPGLRNKITADVIHNVAQLLESHPNQVLEQYRQRSLIEGKRISVELENNEIKEAMAQCINDDYSLHVVFDDGTEQDLRNEEVSVHMA